MLLPKVMVAIPTKNDAHFLDAFFREIENLDYPKENLRFVWMYGKSIDLTLEKILKFHKTHSYKYEVYEEPLYTNITGSSMWLADVMNALKTRVKDEDFILQSDTDVSKIPPDSLKQLIEVDKDIVAPYVWIEGTHPLRFFDTYVFRVNKQKFPALNPPFMNSKVPVKLDSAGTLLLIKAEVYKKIQFENPAPNFQFCKNARKAGYTVWALPYVNILHANVEGIESPHASIEWYVRQGVLPRTILDKMKDEVP